MTHRFVAILCLACTAVGVGVGVAQEETRGEAAVVVEPKSERASSDVSEARIVDRASGATLQGNLEVTFADGKTRLNPGALKNVEWESDGSSIVGRLRAPNGAELAILDGTVGDGGISGTFRDAVGRAGTWKWTGELPPKN